MPDDATLSRPLVVLHVITRMVKGGAQEVVVDLVTRLDPSRFSTILVSGPSDGPEGSLVDKAKRLGVKIHIIPCLLREISLVNDFRALVALVRLMRFTRPDIVHTHTSKAGILGRIAAYVARVPVAIHCPHGHVFHGYYGELKSSLFVVIENWCARYAHRLIMITRNELADHVALRIAPADKFVVIPSGVDLDALTTDTTKRGTLRRQFHIDAKARVVGTMGRLVPIKGQAYLIDAMPAVLAKIPDAHLILIGAGPLLAELENRAALLGISDRVHFAGYRSDIAACLKDLDLFALPSINEGMGRVLVEAMALRLPVVASDVCGIRDLVFPGVNGLLIPPANSGTLASSIIEVLSDAERAQLMGNEGYSIAVPKYGLDAMIAETERLYAEEFAKVSAKRR